MSDYGRLGADGKPRELHIEKALDVTKLETPSMPCGQVGEITVNGEDSYRELACCDLFTSGIISLKKEFTIKTKESFVSLIILDGNATVKWDNDAIEAKKGDSIFVPAGIDIKLYGKAEIICSYI